jgi:hypothetical protein
VPFEEYQFTVGSRTLAIRARDVKLKDWIQQAKKIERARTFAKVTVTWALGEALVFTLAVNANGDDNGVPVGTGAALSELLPPPQPINPAVKIVAARKPAIGTCGVRPA